MNKIVNRPTKRADKATENHSNAMLLSVSTMNMIEHVVDAKGTIVKIILQYIG